MKEVRASAVTTMVVSVSAVLKRLFLMFSSPTAIEVDTTSTQLVSDLWMPRISSSKVFLTCSPRRVRSNAAITNIMKMRAPNRPMNTLLIKVIAGCMSENIARSPPPTATMEMILSLPSL